MKVDIDDAIVACKLLKKSSLHTESFWVHHSQLVVLNFLKKIGFKAVSLVKEENVPKSK